MVYYHTRLSAHPCVYLPWGLIIDVNKDEPYCTSLRNHLFLLAPSRKIIWFWASLISGIWDMVFELVLSVVMVMGSPFQYPLVCSINMLLILLLGNSSVPLKGSSVGFNLANWMSWWLVLDKDLWFTSHWVFHLDTYWNLQILELCRMACYCVCLWGFGLSLKRSGVSVSVSTSLIVAKLLVRGVGIFCLPPYGALITYNMNSVRYFQLLELLNLPLSPTWLIPTSVSSLRAD